MDIPATMKAVRFHEHGGLEVLKYEDAPVPEVGPNDALVRVNCCALNHLDIWIRKGARGWRIPMPHIVGADVSGELVAVGSEVTHVEPGMECFVHPGVPGGPSAFKFAGDDNIAPDYGVLGVFQDGGYAQYVRVPGESILPKPGNLSWEEAAAFPLTFLTAWHMLGSRRASLRAGETVLVIGASSGVGSSAVQVARARGASMVIATAGSADKLKRATALGADHVIDHYAHEGEIHKAVYELTGGQGVDVVVEHVGPAVFGQCVKALSRGGRLVTCGATTGPRAELDIQLMYAKHLTLYGSFMGSRGEMLELLPLVENGTLKPVVDKVFPLAEAAAAQQRMEQSDHFGKIVLKAD